MSEDDARGVLGKACGSRRTDEADRDGEGTRTALTRYLTCSRPVLPVMGCPVEIDVGIFRNRVAELLVTCSFDGNAEELQAWRGKVVRALDLRYGTRDIGRSLMTHGPVWRTDESLEVALQDLPVDAAVPVPGLQVKPQRVVIRYSDVYAVGQRTGEAIEKDAREIVEASKKL